jgi:hypothetical protein
VFVAKILMVDDPSKQREGTCIYRQYLAYFSSKQLLFEITKNSERCHAQKSERNYHCSLITIAPKP